MVLNGHLSVSRAGFKGNRFHYWKYVFCFFFFLKGCFASTSEKIRFELDFGAVFRAKEPDSDLGRTKADDPMQTPLQQTLQCNGHPFLAPENGIHQEKHRTLD